MATLSLKVINQADLVKCVASGEDEVCLVNTAEYAEGDRICLETDVKNIHVWLQVDDALGAAFVYITDNVSFYVPFLEKKSGYSPKAFSGDRHYLYARIAREDEIYAYRNLALNPCDQHGDTHCYPHAWANVETRNEAVFAARNAIDGVIANLAHGKWPYESWGINRREDAAITVEFGREIVADKLVLYTRADFPHDNWWKQARVTFSDGEAMTLEMEKSTKPHVFPIQPRKTTSITIDRLIKSDEPSPFPALTQVEVFGYVSK